MPIYVSYTLSPFYDLTRASTRMQSIDAMRDFDLSVLSLHCHPYFVSRELRRRAFDITVFTQFLLLEIQQLSWFLSKL